MEQVVTCMEVPFLGKMFLIMFIFITFFITWIMFVKSGKYFYGRWLGHYMAVRILLAIVLGIVLLAIPFGLIQYYKIELVNSCGKTSETVDALLQGLCTIITGLGVVAAYVLKSDENNRQNTLKYTTESRSKWMEDGRQVTSGLCETVSEYLSILSGGLLYHEVYTGGSLYPSVSPSIPDIGKSKDAYNRINGLISNLYMRFNFNGTRDKVLLVLLEKISTKILNLQKRFEKHGFLGLPSDEEKQEIGDLLGLFILHLQIYNKVEWERLKMEVKYVGNVEARDFYIKEQMVYLRNTYYKNQCERELLMFPMGIPKYLIGLSVLTIYSNLQNEKEFSSEFEIKPAEETREKMRTEIRNLAELSLFWKICICLLLGMSWLWVYYKI